MKVLAGRWTGADISDLDEESQSQCKHVLYALRGLAVTPSRYGRSIFTRMQNAEVVLHCCRSTATTNRGQLHDVAAIVRNPWPGHLI